MDTTQQFLDALFAGKSDQEYILIWLCSQDAKSKQSGWFTDTAAAAAFVAANRASYNVYVGVALSPADYGPHQRLKVEGGERPPSSIVAFWADLDILNLAHKKKNLPATEEEARSILFPEFPPSLLIHSGGGLQAWWIFKEPWVLDNIGEIQKAGELSTRWIRALRARGAAKAWDVDSVGDLPRVLRVPGTLNHKIAGQPRPVQLIDINDRRYNPSDLEEYLDLIGAEKTVRKVQVEVHVGNLTYSSDAAVSFETIDALCLNVPKFRDTWDHLRKDFKDQSASSYDMALANFAVQAGWGDQEIVNMLIMGRRRHNEDLKLRDSYYIPTVRAARLAFQSSELIAGLDDMIASKPDVRDDAGEASEIKHQLDPNQEKLTKCEHLSGLLGVKILRIARYMTDPPEFALDTEKGKIRLGDVVHLCRQDMFHYKIAAIACHVIPKFKGKDWEKIEQLLLHAAIDVHVGVEGTEEGKVFGWLAGYLEGRRAIYDCIELADQHKAPFKARGKVWFYLVELQRWANLNRGDKVVSSKELTVLLRRAGCDSEKHNIGKTSRTVWHVPEGFVIPEAPKKKSEAPSWVDEKDAPEESEQ